MKAWKVFLKSDNALGARWVVLASDIHTNDTLVEEIVDSGMVHGTFYRQNRIYFHENGGSVLELTEPTYRMIERSTVEQVEEISHTIKVV